MIDRGLLLTLVVMAAGVSALVRVAPPRTTPRKDLTDIVSLPLFVGLATARLTTVALDDPSALRRLGDLLLIRGGMDLWAGVLAGSIALVVDIRRRRHASALPVLADVAPYALWAVAIYEGTCVLRDGCFGPASPFGLHPAGVGYRQLPIGLIVGGAVAVLGVVVRRLAASDPPAAVIVAVAGLASVRSVAAEWLPRISDGLTRQHRQSIAVLVIAIVAGAAIVVTRLRFRAQKVGNSYSES